MIVANRFYVMGTMKIVIMFYCIFYRPAVNKYGNKYFLNNSNWRGKNGTEHFNEFQQ